MLTVFGEQTAAGLVIVNTGEITQFAEQVLVKLGAQTPFQVNVKVTVCP